ncbi:MAG: alpha/beta hydrolase [Cytophagales bacterium]|nr:alpha/beta hydrolase [Rhizobacter sp.]
MPGLPARDTHQPKAPSVLLMLLEGRAPWELAATLAASPLLSRLPRGDGHPVLVFPGLSAPDATTLPLRTFLRAIGYEPYEWEQGFNLGPRHGVLERCRERADTLYKKHGVPVSLVGWSLGGVYAREVAKELPKQTRCVVTLGTPFSGHPRSNNAWRLYEMVSGHRLDEADALINQVRHPPPVPTTSIYSRTDGVVSWQCSLNEVSPLAENIAVHASHMGMGMNPLVLYALADRLTQKPGQWRPFQLEGRRKWFFKTPSGAAVSHGQEPPAA